MSRDVQSSAPAASPSIMRALEGSVREKILPVMKDYMSTYANPAKSILTSTIDSVYADVGVKDANRAAATAPPVALHVPQRKRNTHDASTVLFNPNRSDRTTSRLQTQQHSRPSGGLLHPLHHSTTASSSGVRDEESKSQLHRFACMFKWTKEYPANGGGALSVQQWSPMLLRDVNKEVDPEGGHRPHPLRVAASMHVVEAAFKALHIPMSFFEDLESAVYVAHAGISTHQHPNTLSQHKKSSSPLDVTIDLRPVPRLFAFEALRDATTQRRVLSEKAVSALTQFDTMHQNLDAYVHRDKAHKLFQHFAAWRCLTRVTTTFRRAVTLQKDAKTSSTWKRVVFYSWKSYVSVSRVESELEHLQLHVEMLMEKHQVEVAQQAAQFRKQIDSERRSHDDALTEVKATQLTPEMRRQHEDRLLQLKHAETQNAEDKRRIAETEVKLKDLIVFREQCSSMLRGTVDRLQQTLSSLLGRRRLDGMRAAAVIAVAYKVEAGSMGSMEDLLEVAGRGSSSLDVVQPPVSCGAASILLAWANIALGDALAKSSISAAGGAHSSSSGTSAPSFVLPLRAIGPELADVSVYAALWRVIDPDAAAPPRIMSQSDAAVRMRMFHSELEEFLLDAAAEGTTNGSDGGKRGWKVAAAAVTKNLRWSVMSLSSVSVEALLAGDASAHTFVLFLMMQLYSSYHLPNVTEQLDRSGFVVASLSSRIYSLPSSGHNGAATTRTVESLEKLDEFSDVLRDQCTALHFAQRSVIAWRTVASHVEADILGRSAAWSPSSSSSGFSSAASPGQVATLLAPHDKRLPYFTVRGLQMLAVMDREARNLSQETANEGGGGTTSDTPVDDRAIPTLRKASTVALMGGNQAEEDEDVSQVLERLAEVVPSNVKRQELFNAMERVVSSMADVYCAHSGGTSRLRMPQCHRLLVECCIPVLEEIQEPIATLGGSHNTGSFAQMPTIGRALSGSFDAERSPLAALPSTQQQVLERYLLPIRTDGGLSSGKAFTPLSFMFMIAELAVLIGARSPMHILEGMSAGAARTAAVSPARLFEAAAYQFFVSRVPRPIFCDAAFRGVHQVPLGIFSKRGTSGDVAPPYTPSALSAVVAIVDAPLATLLTSLWDALPLIVPASSSKSRANSAVGSGVGLLQQQSLNFEEFTKLWKELDVLEGSGAAPSSLKLSSADAKSIFQFFAVSRAFTTEEGAAAVKGAAAPGRGGGGGGKATISAALSVSMSLRDFVDVLAMISSFTHPSPLYSYSGRLKAFVHERITPVMKKKFPAISFC